ncbi:MAG: hypothetical protein MUC93_05315 [Bacteroidales bacterium]|jgi:hypothetical protein|nr:hypothetical protein [Bacteroidales bacterium]
MKKFILILVFSTLIFKSCEKTGKDSPDCIRDKIREFAKNKNCERGSSVSQFLFKDGYVYLFEQGNCGADLGSSVYDEACEYLGFLGGIAGNMIIQGVRFDQEAVFVKKIWED